MHHFLTSLTTITSTITLIIHTNTLTLAASRPARNRHSRLHRHIPQHNLNPQSPHGPKIQRQKIHHPRIGSPTPPHALRSSIARSQDHNPKTEKGTHKPILRPLGLEQPKPRMGRPPSHHKPDPDLARTVADYLSSFRMCGA